MNAEVDDAYIRKTQIYGLLGIFAGAAIFLLCAFISFYLIEEVRGGNESIETWHADLTAIGMIVGTMLCIMSAAMWAMLEKKSDGK